MSFAKVCKADVKIQMDLNSFYIHFKDICDLGITSKQYLSKTHPLQYNHHNKRCCTSQKWRPIHLSNNLSHLCNNSIKSNSHWSLCFCVPCQEFDVKLFLSLSWRRVLFAAVAFAGVRGRGEACKWSRKADAR